MVMQINTSNAGDRVVIKLAGRFDFNEHRVLKAAYEPVLQQTGIKSVEIDMAGIEYLDSSALGMLMLMRERAQAAGKTAVISHPNSTVAQILEIANFGKLFTIIQ